MKKEFARVPKSFVWMTLFAIACVIVVTSVSARANNKQKVVEIDTEGQPTQGSPDAPVQIVVFKEPKCSSCKDFAKDIYPKLKKEYIDTGKVRYTLILVSFLPNSMPAAEAMLCAYYADPAYPNSDHFFQFAEYLYQNQPDESTDWAKTPLLVEFAKKSNASINLEKLQDCISRETYRTQIEKNTAYGKELMGGSISTPTIYVNGIEMRELNYEILSSKIQELIKKEKGKE